jgi:hypothetical protein
MKVGPQAVNLACPIIQKVSTINVGCPSKRKIVFRTVTSESTDSHTSETSYNSHDSKTSQTSQTSHTLHMEDCSSAPSTVTLPSGSWISDWTSFLRPSYSKVISYDCSKYGVPLSVYYGSIFMPVFDIYDGYTYVKTVTADTALWEVNGRNTFDYNTTCAQAGCTIAAQSWSSIASSAKINDPTSIWTPSVIVSLMIVLSNLIVFQIRIIPSAIHQA